MNIESLLNEFSDLNINTNPSSVNENGIVFLYPTWSIDQKYLGLLLQIVQENKHIRSSLIIYVIDIDSGSFQTFSKMFAFTSHGKGEILFIKNGEIVFAIHEPSKVELSISVNEILNANFID